MRPRSTTSTTSARRTVARRWAMMIELRPVQQPVERALDQRPRSAGRCSTSPRRGSGCAGRRAAPGRSRSAAARPPRGPRRPRAPRARAHRAAVPSSRSRPIAAAVSRTSASVASGRREADVVGDRAREEERVLEHHAELAAVARRAAPRAGRCRRRAPSPSAGRRSGRSAWRGSTCRRRSGRRARRTRPAGTWIVDVVEDLGVAVGEVDVVEVDRCPRSGRARAAPGRSPMSGSASSTELTFTIAAAAACSWP